MILYTLVKLIVLMNQSFMLMNMGLNSAGLDAFYICSQEKNFTKAAERLHVTQSALSQRIKNLEEEVGATLFIRDRLGVKLTEAGESLLRYCQSRLQAEQEVIGQIQGNKTDIRGQLRIAGFSTVMRSIVLPTCSQLTSSNPDIQISLMSKEIFELPELLKTAAVDFILIDQELPKEGLKSTFLGYETNVRVRKKGSEFTGYYLDHDEKDETTMKYLKLKSGSKIKRHYMDDIYGVIDGVKMGIADAIVPKHLIAEIKCLEIVESKQSLKIPVYLVHYDNPTPTKLSKTFVEKIVKQAKEIFQ